MRARTRRDRRRRGGDTSGRRACTAEQERVHEKDERTQPHAEPVREVEGPERVDQSRIIGNGNRKVEEEAVQVLEDEGKAALTRVQDAGVAHGTTRRRPEERSVVGLAVVVASQTEGEREREDQQRGRECPPVAHHGHRRFGTARRDARRVERRQVRVGVVIRIRERGPRRVPDEPEQDECREKRFDPPRVLSAWSPPAIGSRLTGPARPLLSSRLLAAAAPRYSSRSSCSSGRGSRCALADRADARVPPQHGLVVVGWANARRLLVPIHRVTQAVVRKDARLVFAEGRRGPDARARGPCSSCGGTDRHRARYSDRGTSLRGRGRSRTDRSSRE